MFACSVSLRDSSCTLERARWFPRGMVRAPKWCNFMTATSNLRTYQLNTVLGFCVTWYQS